MNVQESMEFSVMVFAVGRGGCNTRGGRGDRGHPQCTYRKRKSHVQERCFSLHDFPDKTTSISKLKLSSPNSLMKNTKNI